MSEKGIKDNVTEGAQVTKLLPPATVHLFSDDLEVLNLFQVMGEDWRMARVHMGIRGETIDQAIDYYAKRKSPDLIIIQTDNTNAQFEESLAKLAELCEAGTNAIVIGAHNDVQLYRHLTSIGVSDYLVAPLESEDFMTAIYQSISQTQGDIDSTLVAMIGANGGVGTTSVAALCADGFANHMGQKTLILDLSGAQSTLWNIFDFTPSATLIDCARSIMDGDEDALQRMIVKKSDTLHVLNTGMESILDGAIPNDALDKILDYVLSIYPYVILDCSGASKNLIKSALNRSHAVCHVGTPRVQDLSCVRLYHNYVMDLPGGDHTKQMVVVNKVGLSKSADVELSAIPEALSCDASHIISMPWQGDGFAKIDNQKQSIGDVSKGIDIARQVMGIISPDVAKATEKNGDGHSITTSIKTLLGIGGG